MKNYNILDESQRILNESLSRKPDYIDVADTNWEKATEETRELLISIIQLEKPLKDAYNQAVEHEEWRRALILLQILVGFPYLPSLDPLFHSPEECLKNESEFINRTREWVSLAKHVLQYWY